MPNDCVLPAPDLARFVTQLFQAAGLSADAARRVADALIEADLTGRGSHGVLQADGYLARLVAGAISRAEQPELVSRSGGAVVLDAANIEGHLAAEAAIRIAVTTAREHGVAAVAVRRGFHFGVAGRYARMAAEAGCAAIVMCNAKPVVAAPGGAERLVGTNPLAIGIPAGEGPVVFDMATTTGTYGRIREARAAGRPIPPDWAVDRDGRPTTDAHEAMQGFLLPLAGAKGFGLALMIDMLSGLLATGGWGDALGTIEDDISRPNNSSYLFITLDIEHFRGLEGFLEEADRGVRRVRNSRRAPGTERIFTPGERSAEALAGNDGTVRVAAATLDSLLARARMLNVQPPPALVHP